MVGVEEMEIERTDLDRSWDGCVPGKEELYGD